MIVNKPQFDTDSIKKGSAYWLTQYDYKEYVLNTPCLVKHVTPLSIVVCFYRKKEHDFDELTIDINSVVKGTFKLIPMIIKEEN